MTEQEKKLEQWISNLWQARIDENIAACRRCGTREQPKHPDCAGCTEEADQWLLDNEPMR